MEKRISLHSPNGQFGCLTIVLGSFAFCAGFVPHLAGFDLCWRGHVYSTSNLSEESVVFWQCIALVVICGVIIAELVYLVR